VVPPHAAAVSNRRSWVPGSHLKSQTPVETSAPSNRPEYDEHADVAVSQLSGASVQISWHVPERQYAPATQSS
jgi:hypothetical protein